MIWFVIVCRDCLDQSGGDAPVPFPFDSAAKRGEWAATHTSGTGHDRFRVIDQQDDRR